MGCERALRRAEPKAGGVECAEGEWRGSRWMRSSGARGIGLVDIDDVAMGGSDIGQFNGLGDARA